MKPKIYDALKGCVLKFFPFFQVLLFWKNRLIVHFCWWWGWLIFCGPHECMTPIHKSYNWYKALLTLCQSFDCCSLKTIPSHQSFSTRGVALKKTSVLDFCQIGSCRPKLIWVIVWPKLTQKKQNIVTLADSVSEDWNLHRKARIGEWKVSSFFFFLFVKLSFFYLHSKITKSWCNL